MSDPRNSSKSGPTAPKPGVVMDVKEANAKYLLSAEQQIPKGYKQTEVGVIPRDWECKKLESLIMPGTSITYGIVQAGPDVMDGVPYIKTGDMSGNCLSLDGLTRTSKEIAARFPRSTIHSGELVYSIRASVGAVHYVPPELDGANLTQGTARISAGMTVSAIFLLNALRSTECQNWVDRNTKGSTYREITLEKLRQLPVAIPPTKAEQEAIAEALSDADALIEALEQLIAKKRQLKRGAMQELLAGTRRLPGFSGDWRSRRLEEISDIKTGPFGSSLHESDYVQNGTPIITVEHLGEFGVTQQNLPLVSDVDRIRLHAYSLELGDIVFSRVGSVDRNALIREDEVGWLFSGRLLRIRPNKEQVFPHFLSYQFHSEQFRNSVLAVAVGQTMASLNTKILSDLTVFLPTLEEQTAIAQILTDMDAEITELETKLTKARAIKQGMMQQLLTGKIRLVVNPKPIIDN